MNITLEPEVYDKLSDIKAIAEAKRNIYKADKIRVDLEMLEEKDIVRISKTPGVSKRALSAIKTWDEARKDPLKAIPQNVEQAEGILKEYIKRAPGLMLYKKVDEGSDISLPYIVTKVMYYKKQGRGQNREPAHVRLDVQSFLDGEKVNESIQVYRKNIKGGKNAKEILEQFDLTVATKELNKKYAAQLAKYNELIDKTGTQLVGDGFARPLHNTDYSIAASFSHRRRLDSLITDGIKTRLVIDDRVDTQDADENQRRSKKQSVDPDETTTDITFWKMTKKQILADDEVWNKDNEEIDDEEIDEGTIPTPVHPYLLVFNMSTHDHCLVHVANVQEYQYDETKHSQLVLPEENKELVEILIEHANSNFKDIITGKSGGSIVLCAGVPGTGKTLTAEVYAEVMKRPLYNVQSSQLGTEAVQLEKHLKQVLQRSTRWGAILLIDEADVFIHARGSDLKQNAIVGVFLRTLEYYRGVLFLTTNRSVLIDDAIASRCTARIEYKVPTLEQQLQIWGIMIKNSNMKVDMKEITKFAKAHPNTTGRDIKNLVKLSNLISKARKAPITFDVLEYVLKFKSTEGTNADA
ncbi:ATP-binding protein [Methylobacter sp.]|uniref:AAA family ATPase n=1 Tax=Methylobacter sp. TaxID=2051955 RepID=UPI00121D0FEC|nr:ATP-binding protein [Methylobacter sp.]TAK59545.1 MAG: ATP-binding protein [Methylobacter sp.]